jgi:hypothetical protein
MGGTAATREVPQTLDQVQSATVAQDIMHPVFGKLAICNCLFTNGKKGLAYKKDVMIESTELANRLLEYSKQKSNFLKDKFMTVYGYKVERNDVRSILTQGMCGNSTVVSIYFEPFETSLLTLVTQRRDQSLGRLTENEAVQIINSICSVATE